MTAFSARPFLHSIETSARRHRLSCSRSGSVSVMAPSPHQPHAVKACLLFREGRKRRLGILGD